MAHNKNRRHPSATFQSSATSESPNDHSITVGISEESHGCEPDLNDRPRVGDLEHETTGHDRGDVPSEMAHEVWDALKEEFYEQVEQLPLSLHRSFALIGEQDEEVEACRAELLPTIRSYVKLRQSLRPDLSRSILVQDSHKDDRSLLTLDLHGPRLENEGVSLDASAPGVEQQCTNVFSERETRPETHHEPIHTQHKEEDVDVVMGDISLEAFPHVPVSSPAVHIDSTAPETPSPQPLDPPHQSASARTQGLRETDASVPKSAPFPPRPKPKTTRELLVRIAFLMGEVIRASEEKVGLAAAAYDSVDRHVRVLDTAIKEHEAVADLEPSEGAWPAGRTRADANDPASNPTADDDDEEPQLGMIGPSGLRREDYAGLRRGKKSDRRDKRTHPLAGNPASRVNTLPPTTKNQLPIDPHEPRYCYCHQVSYGEMIACDNADCSREWFHLGCAGLSAPPKGKVKWYCRECEEGKKRRVR